MTPVSSRAEIVRLLWDLSTAAINIDGECGYPTQLCWVEAWRLYQRESVPARIVEVWPEATWEDLPTVSQPKTGDKPTPWDQQIADLINDLNVWSAMYEADTLSGIGQSALVFLGFDDAASPEDLKKPASAKKLNYLHVYPQPCFDVMAFDTDVASPRRGLPNMYRIWPDRDRGKAPVGDYTDPNSKVPVTSEAVIGESGQPLEVHWTRVLPVHDHARGGTLIGSPSRLTRTLNGIHNLRKISGGSAQSVWRNGIAQLFLELDPDAEYTDDDKEEFLRRSEKFARTLDRVMPVKGAKPHSVAPNVPDVSPNWDMAVDEICVGIGVPRRVFLRRDGGQLGTDGDQEFKIFQGKVEYRRDRVVTPYIIKPFINLLILAGVVPDSKFEVAWNHSQNISMDQLAERAAKLTKAISDYISGECDVIIPPRQWLSWVLMMPPEMVENLMVDVEKRLQERYDAMNQQAAAQLAVLKAKAAPHQDDPSSKPTGSSDDDVIELQNTESACRHGDGYTDASLFEGDIDEVDHGIGVDGDGCHSGSVLHRPAGSDGREGDQSLV